MQQNTTTRGKSSELTIPQTKALGALLAGETVTRAAERAGADRTTVHRWLREDWDFQAAYNAARRNLQREIEGRLLQIARSAAETVAAAVDHGDVRASLAVLRGIGLLAGAPPQIDGEDPAELAEEADLAARERASERAIRSVTAL